MKYFDIESREIITEEQLREEFEALQEEQPDEYRYSFGTYLVICTSKNGTLIPVYEQRENGSARHGPRLRAD